MGKALNVCASVLAVISMIFLFVTLCVPWYFQSKSVSVAGDTAGSIFLYGWTRSYCIGRQFCDDYDSDWKKQEGAADFAHVFNATLGMMIVSILSLTVAVGLSFVRCCSKSSVLKRNVAIGATAFSFLFTFISIIYFAKAVPKAQNCSDSDADASKVCSDLYGSYSIGDTSFGASGAWGGVGWAIAIPTAFFTLITLILFAVSRDENKPNFGSEEYSTLKSDY
eukprot:TRINITY_DN2116_c0_g1_i1.p1 TRINITY_DN2116_c0_g1~~TRINITY_DN2116_c0_g1_i1.p1  ORF type:complete len:242 (+),score=58.78 TRINITY_DN2116_c0_g1_i1:58-726(+)